MDQKRIKEVLSDETFVKELSKLENVEEIQDAFKKKNLYFSIDELNKFNEQFISKGELSLDQMDEVAGGSFPVIGVAYAINIIGSLKKLFG
jgi:hypothetical protein